MPDRFSLHIEAIEPSFKSRPPCTYKLQQGQANVRIKQYLKPSDLLFFVAESDNESTVVRTSLGQLTLQPDFDPVVALEENNR